MIDLKARVLDCFSSVFPDLPATDLLRVSQASHAAWDSVAHVTLFAVLSEEFGVEFDFEELEQANSFETVLEMVQRRNLTL
jgi:acyl carrier protein